MKKRIVYMALALILLFTATACGSKEEVKVGNQTLNNSQTVQELLDGAEDGASGETADDAPANTARCVTTKPYDGELDVDLTTLTSTMVYSEVYNMVTTPKDYEGKIVKMNGAFSIYQTEERNYYACIIADATACCSQGIEFVLDGDFAYPEDYPELGTNVTIIGTFDTYMEGEYQYCQLIDAQMI